MRSFICDIKVDVIWYTFSPASQAALTTLSLRSYKSQGCQVIRISMVRPSLRARLVLVIELLEEGCIHPCMHGRMQCVLAFRSSVYVHISLCSPSNTGSDLVDYVYVLNDENVPSVGNSFWQKINDVLLG